MKKINYILKKLKTMKFKEYFNRAKEISISINKPTFFMFL